MGTSTFMEWAAAVKKAGSFDPTKVRDAAVALGTEDSPLGGVSSSRRTRAWCRPAYMGELQPDGQFKIVWQSTAPIAPEPYDPLTFPGKSCKLH